MNKEINSMTGIIAGVVVLVLAIIGGIFFLNRQPPLNPNGIAASALKGRSGTAPTMQAKGKQSFGQVRGGNMSD